jgi:hypothetical protein
VDLEWKDNGHRNRHGNESEIEIENEIGTRSIQSFCFWKSVPIMHFRELRFRFIRIEMHEKIDIYEDYRN